MRLLVFLGFLVLTFLVPAGLAQADSTAENVNSSALVIDGN
jgi:hypothetical protein